MNLRALESTIKDKLIDFGMGSTTAGMILSVTTHQMGLNNSPKCIMLKTIPWISKAYTKAFARVIIWVAEQDELYITPSSQGFIIHII